MRDDGCSARRFFWGGHEAECLDAGHLQHGKRALLLVNHVAVGQNQWHHFGVGALAVRDFDPWPRVKRRVFCPDGELSKQSPASMPTTAFWTALRELDMFVVVFVFLVGGGT